MADELTKRFYRISDVAELLGLPQSTIRYWESEFPALRPQRSPGGKRLYTPADVEVLRVIRFLIKDKGLTVQGAREHMKHNRLIVNRRHEVIRRLQKIRSELTELLEALGTRR